MFDIKAKLIFEFRYKQPYLVGLQGKKQWGVVLTDTPLFCIMVEAFLRSIHPRSLVILEIDALATLGYGFR